MACHSSDKCSQYNRCATVHVYQVNIFIVSVFSIDDYEEALRRCHRANQKEAQIESDYGQRKKKWTIKVPAKIAVDIGIRKESAAVKRPLLEKLAASSAKKAHQDKYTETPLAQSTPISPPICHDNGKTIIIHIIFYTYSIH